MHITGGQNKSHAHSRQSNKIFDNVALQENTGSTELTLEMIKQSDCTKEI